MAASRRVPSTKTPRHLRARAGQGCRRRGPDRLGRTRGAGPGRARQAPALSDEVYVPALGHGEGDRLQGRHLQQLLRVRLKPSPTWPRTPGRSNTPWTVEVEGLVKKPGVLASRICSKPALGRPHLPAALRRGLVDVDPQGRTCAGRVDQESSRRATPDPSSSSPSPTRAMPFVGSACSIGRMPKATGRTDALLTLLTFGMYGEVTCSNGAPVRIVVIEYGFKSAKSIVKIRFCREGARHGLEQGGGQRVRFLFERESGCRSRWSQATERRIGDGEAGIRQAASRRHLQRPTSSRSAGSARAWT